MHTNLKIQWEWLSFWACGLISHLTLMPNVDSADTLFLGVRAQLDLRKEQERVQTPSQGGFASASCTVGPAGSFGTHS